MDKQKIRSQKHVKKQKQQQRRRWVALFFLVFILLGGLIALSRWQVVQIKSFTINANQELPQQQMRKMVSAQLDNKLWYIFARNNILLLPRKDIINRITNLTPRIKSAQINITGLRSFSVNIRDRQPVAQVCSSYNSANNSTTRTSTATTTGCLLVDKTGYIYTGIDNRQASSTKLFKYQADNIDIGTQLIPEPTFRVLESFINKLSELSFEPIYAVFKNHQDIFIATQKQSATTTASSTTVQLRVNLADDLNQKYTDLKTVVEKNSFVTSTPSGGVKPISPFALEYIDLRFGNKVFYR